jgi:hypothetical protein
MTIYLLTSLAILHSSLPAHAQVSQVLASADPRLLAGIAGVLFLAVLLLALRTSATLVAVLLSCASMLGFAAWLARWVMAKDEGTVDMQEVDPRPCCMPFCNWPCAFSMSISMTMRPLH